MARLGSEGDVSITVGTEYDPRGMDQARKDMMSYAEWMKGKMGPAMKEFGSHGEAMKHLSEQWKIYKATGVDANESVARSAAASSEKMATSYLAVKSAWLQVGAVIAATAWFRSAMQAALENEIAFNKLRIQIEGMGIAYRSVARDVEAAVEASARYAHIQDNEVARTLQEIQFHSGKYDESLKYLNLTLDLSYQKSISYSEAALLVGKALSGNVSMLGRVIPELVSLDDKLGKDRTSAMETAYAMAIMTEKVNKANEQMTEHEKQVKELTKTYQDFHQGVGSVLGFIRDVLVYSLNTYVAAYKEALDVTGYNKLLKMFGLLAEQAPAQAKSHRDIADAYRISAKEIEKLAKLVSEEYEKKKAVADINKQLVSDTEDLVKQTNKLRLDETNYLEWLKGSLLVKGASVDVVNKMIATQKGLNKAQSEQDAKQKEAEAFKTVENRILDSQKAIEKLRDNKADLMTVEAQEIVILGATAAQLQRYLDLRNEQAGIEEKAKRFKEQVEALGKLSELEQSSPYGAKAALEEAAQKNEVAKIYLTYQTKLQALQDYNTQVLQEMVIAGKSQADIEARYRDLNIQAAEKEKNFKIQSVADMAGATANMMQNLFVATGNKHKEMFELGKVFSIAQAIINTEEGATKALAQGGFWGVAMAATVIAAGAANIATIYATKPGGGSISSSGSASPPYSGGSYDAYPIPQRLTQQNERPIDLTVIINHPLGNENWDKITEENIIPAVNRALKRDITLNI